MKARRKKFVSMFLALLMLFSMFPTYAEAKTPTGHTHDGWIELTQDILETTVEKVYVAGTQVTAYNLGKLASGETTNMVLTEDITLNYRMVWIKESSTLNLCLNGHLINGNSNVAFEVASNGAVLNIFDCNDGIKYFTDSNSDGCFDIYDKNYDAAGKSEGTDYICVNGGAIFNATSFIIVNDKAVAKLNDVNVVGEQAKYASESVDNKPYLFHVNGELCISNSVIVGCTAEVSIINNQGKVSIVDGSRIEFNRTGRSIIDNDVENTIELSNCSIRNNVIIASELFLNYAVACWGNEIKFSGKVIIADNFKYKNGDYPGGECEQKNLCVINRDFSDIPFDGSDLSPESFVGLSLQSTSLVKGEKKEVVLNPPSANIFFSDDPTYILKQENKNAVLENRLHEQPSKDNEYVFGINEDGADVNYQWYKATVDTVAIDDTIVVSKFGEYDAGKWTSQYQSSYGCWGYYSLEANKGDVLSFNITADEDEFTDDTMICYMGMESEFDSLAFRKISYGEKISAQFPQTDTYIIGGCFGDEAVSEDWIMENASLNRLTLGDKLEGQTSNKLTYNCEGTYICEATVTDLRGRCKSVLSDVVNIIFERVNVSFDMNGQGTAPDPQIVVSGEKATTPQNPTASDLVFEGWYLEPECENAFDFETAITSNVILYAGWKFLKPTGVEGGFTVIDGVDSTMEYMPIDGTEWFDITGTQVKDISGGDYYVRVKAEGKTLASDAVTVTVTGPVKPDAPTGVEGGINVITGVDTTMEYQLVGATEWTAITTTELTDVVAGDYYVRIKAEGNNPSSDFVKVTVCDPSPVKPEAPTDVKGGINVITGVDSTMEYQLVGATEWTAITTTELTNVVAGDYYVRIKAEGNNPSSDSVKITVNDLEPDPDPEPEPVEVYYAPLVADLKANEEGVIEWKAGDSLPLEAVKLLVDKPELSLEFTFTYEGEEHTIFIPAGAFEKYYDVTIPWYGPAWLIQYFEKSEKEVIEYTIVSGDTLNALAEKFKCTVEEILALNPYISDKHWIYPNNKLLIPVQK